jgi:hypothetical protein
MTDQVLLRVTGEVDKPLGLTFDDLSAVDDDYQFPDVSRLLPSRKGDALILAGLLKLAGVKDTARYLGLHSSTDDFHASIPLAPVREKALVIYRLEGKPLATSAGGPIRFYIPDHARCHSDEIDECANVKFVDHIELTAERGFDNRPEDEEEHQRLHDSQA